MVIKRLQVGILIVAVLLATAGVAWFTLGGESTSAEAVASETDTSFAAFDDVEPLVGQTKKKSGEEEPAKAPEADGDAETEDDSKVGEPDEKAPVAKPKPRPEPKPKVKKVDWKPAVLEVVTNFEKADVKVNGIPYPEYTAPGEDSGVVLPAGGPYWVEVTVDGNTKTYRIYLRPNETRMLLVDLTGFNGKRPPPPAKPSVPERAEKQEEKKEEGDKEPGKVTVYSKPPGTIMVDGDKTSDKTPGTLEVENGRHEIQVEYDGGGISEKKIVRVREGSRIKLFFRKRD
jgi:outer membrane biosynthesis protein TonB